MDLMETLKTYKAKIDGELARFFDEKKRSFRYKDEFVDEAFDLLKDYTLRGGKRFRPTMVIMTYRGISGDTSDTKILRPAASIEFMQSSLLTHDDIMDESKLRRGKPTPHVWVANWYKKRVKNDEKCAEKFGRDMAIIIGDLFNSYGIQCVMKNDFPYEKRVNALNIYNDTYETTGKGQILDIWFGERNNVKSREEDYFNIIDRKTVQYTVEKPALLGAEFAGATQEQKDLISKFAIPIARGFQIQDDILDVLSTEEKLGKPIGTDIREGKDTLIAIYAKDHATPEQMEILKSIIGKFDASKDEIMQVKKVFEDTGALDYAKQKARELVLEGKKYLPELEKTRVLKETIDFYNAFADYLVERKY